jgi:hypothetical protein
MNEKITEAINQYYTLKKNYETEINKKKKIILRDESLSVLEKKKRISKIQKKCINCKKIGGTIFSNDGSILRAVCGNTTSPCNLNIEINRGKFKDLRDVYYFLEQENETTKKKIITNKLDLLFNYKSEEDVIKDFNELKTSYNDIASINALLKTSYMTIIKNLENKDKLKLALDTIYQQIEELKNLAKEFDETQQMSYIKEMVEKYTTIIQPLVKNIRELKYNKQQLECMDKTFIPCTEQSYFLIQEPYTLADFEFSFTEKPEILINTK